MACVRFVRSLTMFAINVALCYVLLNSCVSVTTVSAWEPAAATWYGPANGDGSEGGACGYGSAVGQTPFSSMISAGGPSLYKSGSGCGACYQVMCTENSACSGKPVTVVITDECPGCATQSVHFDLSGTAFGALAKSGMADQLRNAGTLNIQHQRVDCSYGGVSLSFHVDAGSTGFYFATVVEYVNGDGDLSAVDLKEGGSSEWRPMQHNWGASWKINSAAQLTAPFSIRLTTLLSGKTLVINDVIPAGWVPGNTYHSTVNF